MAVNKILCCCISGLGSSFIVEMNVKKILKELGRSSIQVEHSGIQDAMVGSADLFICSSDVYDECCKAGDTIPLERLTDLAELRGKLVQYFAQQ